VSRNIKEKNGTRGQMVHELPQFVRLKYKLGWERPKLDLAELAKNRWIKKWSIPKISTEMGFSPVSVQKALRKLREGEITKLTLKPEELKAIMPSLQENFKGVM